MKTTNDTFVQHLRKSRHYAKGFLDATSEFGSVLISHKIIITTPLADNEILETTIDMLPVVRLYRTNNTKIVDDENLLNEDMEESSWD
jgi:hypothetical protein